MRFRHSAILFIVFLTSLLASFTAFATSLDDIRALIAAGQYEQARTLAAEVKTAEGYVLAAESLSSQIMLGEVSKLNKNAKKAREFAEMALALDPNSYEARLQYALTDGFVTRTTGNLTAWRKKLPMRTYNAIQAFRQDYPNDARAIALEGAWHFGVVRKTGDKNGQKWFGASAGKGHALYKDAIEIDPQNIVIRTNYVMAVLALKSDPDLEVMKRHLEDIMLMTPITDVDMKVKALS